MPKQTKKFETQNEYVKYRKDRVRKAKANKVRLDLDEYHKELGGLFDKKVIFYCMPKQTGKTKKAIKKFNEYGGSEKGQLITIIDGSPKETHGIVFHNTQYVDIDGDSSFIIIDDIHLLSTKKIIAMLVDFGISEKTTRLVCFGTNVDKYGKPIEGAGHLERMAGEVIYDSSPCYSCGRYGKTCFTKILFEKYQPHPSDCRISDDEDGYFYERDLCFDCRRFGGR